MINDIYYTTVVKQEAQELRNRAAQDRLAREAKQLRRRQRADQREINTLEHAVHGKPTWWSLLIGRFFGRSTAKTGQRIDAAAGGNDQGNQSRQTGATTHKA